MRQCAGTGQAPEDRLGWRGGYRVPFAASARVGLSDMAYDPDLSGNDVELLGGLVTDRHHDGVTRRATTICRIDFVDHLIPAALGSVIHADNADQLSTKLIVEAANGPVTPEADMMLAAKGVLIMPDILANAGGVTVSYLEWIQNLTNQQWPVEKVNKRLQEVMTRAVDRVVERWEQLNARAPGKQKETPDLRTAALVVAINQVSKVTLQRGIWP